MKVVGIGDNVADCYEHCQMMYPGGNALNFSVYAHMLGIDSAYVGVFGNDGIADFIQTQLRRLDVDFSLCKQVPGENGYARLTIEQGERVFLGSNAGGIAQQTSMSFIREYSDYLTSFSLAHCGCYGYMDDQLAFLKTLGVLVSYDFSDDFDLKAALRLCSMIDFGFFSCSDYSEQQTVKILQQAHANGCSVAIATRASDDVIAWDGYQMIRYSPKPITPVDTLGAGDAFICAFLMNYLQKGASSQCIDESLKKGCEFAEKICGLNGAFGQGIVIHR
ncbi:MAG: Fructosamine kinase FrlD [Candidatus Celerinatantimonas neptuna]|nr:MAG: Fructosamine kinase FrlD [Candidatus Celerinatantimonas neptuna]